MSDLGAMTTVQELSMDSRAYPSDQSCAACANTSQPPFQAGQLSTSVPSAHRGLAGESRDLVI